MRLHDNNDSTSNLSMTQDDENKNQAWTVWKGIDVAVKVIVVGILILFVDSGLLSRRKDGVVRRKRIGKHYRPALPSPPWIVHESLPGQWVHVGRNRTFAAPVCCGWYNQVYLQNPQQCGSQPINHHFYRGLPADSPFYQQIAGTKWDNGQFYDEWEWRASDLPPFVPTQACTRLGNRTVLIMGDSTGQQTASTLMNALKVGGCGPQIMFALADTLVHKEMGVRNAGVHWLDAVREHNPDIVIMNAGAHIKTDANYTLMLDEVSAGIAQRRQNTTKQTTLVWKTQQPAGCTDDIFYPQDPIKAGREFDFSGTPKFKQRRHDVFFRRDLYTIRRLQQMQVLILDLRMLYSRSDAHPSSATDKPIDCLHLVSPGPLDVVAPLFQRMLGYIDQSQT